MDDGLLYEVVVKDILVVIGYYFVFENCYLVCLRFVLKIINDYIDGKCFFNLKIFGSKIWIKKKEFWNWMNGMSYIFVGFFVILFLFWEIDLVLL